MFAYVYQNKKVMLFENWLMWRICSGFALRNQTYINGGTDTAMQAARCYISNLSKKNNWSYKKVVFSICLIWNLYKPAITNVKDYYFKNKWLVCCSAYSSKPMCVCMWCVCVCVYTRIFRVMKTCLLSLIWPFSHKYI